MCMCVCALVVVNFGLDSFYLETFLLEYICLVKMSLGLYFFSSCVFRLAVFAFARYYVKSIHVDRFKRCCELCANVYAYVGAKMRERSR